MNRQNSKLTGRYLPNRTSKQWQIARDNNVMHTKPDLRVFLKWMIARSGSVITDVIQPNSKLLI